MSESRYAVLIGNSDFPREPKLAPLRCPGNDVDGLKEILSSRSYGSFDKVVVLKNEPHYETLLRMDQVFDQADQDDLVLIYYSGHGKQDMEGQLYLASADTLVNSLTVTSIPVEQIRRSIRKSRTNKVILILDCCYSGAVSGAFLRSDIDTELERISKTSRGTYILTASTSLQTAVEREGDQYGLLTKHILEGIKSGRAARDDGLVTMDTLYKYVYDKISSESPQEPMKYELNVRGSDLIISRTASITPDEWRRRVRKKILQLDLPGRIDEGIIQLINLKPGQLTRKHACYKELVDQLLKDQLAVPEFIGQWYAAGERIDRIYDLYHSAQSATDNEAWNDAIDYWEQLLELDPGNTAAITKLQRAQLKKQELVDRIKSIYSQAEVATNKGNWNEAIVQWQALIQLEPGHQEAISTLAEAQLRQKDLEAQVGVIYRAAQSAMEREDWDDAIGRWQALLQLDSNHEEAKTKLEQAQFKNQELADRIKSTYRQAQAATNKGDWNEAIVQWQALIELDPGNKAAKSALAEAQLKQKDLIARISDIYRAAQSAMEREDWDDAIGRWQALLQLDSNHEEAKTKLEQAQLKNQERQSTLKKDLTPSDQPAETPPDVESPPPTAKPEIPEVVGYGVRPKREPSVAEPTQPTPISVGGATSPNTKPDDLGSSPVQGSTPYLAGLRQGLKKCPKCNEPFAARIKFCVLDGTPLVFRSSGAEYLSRLLVLIDALVSKLRKQPRWFFPAVLAGLLLLSLFFLTTLWTLYHRISKPTTLTAATGVNQEQTPARPGSPALSGFTFKTFSVDQNGQPTEDLVERTAKAFEIPIDNGVSLEMVYVPGNTFTIGSTETEMYQNPVAEKPRIEIAVKPFYLGKYEVTREQWTIIALKRPAATRGLPANPSQAPLLDRSDEVARNLPVDSISWLEAEEFAARVSNGSLKCRLPTEAEWEYACRANSSSPFAFPITKVRDAITYNGKEDYRQPITHPGLLSTKPVRSFEIANNFGLFAMHGNVWEWCWDSWHRNYDGIPTNGLPWLTGGDQNRVVRGGSWLYPLSTSRSPTRYSQDPSRKAKSLGFRLACDVQ